VLLSSEARVITYVSKQGQRSEHSLDDVLQTGTLQKNVIQTFFVLIPTNYSCFIFFRCAGRLDIAKRLKYTKDIMYRLINTQSK
jgi:hypothetical protein